MKPKAFSYIRFSSPEQAKGNSLERQTKAARDYAAAHGLELDETLAFYDPGLSAFEGRNFREGALATFVAACDSGLVPHGSFLLVENLDRLSRRKPIEAVGQLQSILGRHVTVVTLFDGKIYAPGSMDDFNSLLMAVVTMQRAHEESALKAMRIGKSWETKRRRAATEKKPMTGMTPGWLRLRDGRFEVIQERAEIVREIFRSTIAGNGNVRIAKMLTTSGVPAFGRAVGWHSSAIQKILENEAVIGTFQPHRVERKDTGARLRVAEGEQIRGYFPAIIDEATFQRARIVRTERRISRGRKGERLSNLFTGLATCAHCSGPMHFDNKGGGHTRLTCGNAKRGAASHAPNSWKYPIAERFTLLALHTHLDLAGMFPTAQAGAMREALSDIEGRLMVAEAAKARAGRTIEQMLKLFEEEDLPTYRDRVRSATKEKQDAEAEATRLEEAADAIRVNIAEGERDRVNAEDALKQWASISEGVDAEEAYVARLALQQLLKRTIARVEFQKATEDDTRHGYISVTSKGGVSVQIVLDDQNDEGELRAGVYDFSLDEKTGNADMRRSKEVTVPDWWPHR